MKNQVLVKLEFYVPETQCQAVKEAVFAAGAGRIGNYDCCCWQTAGTGQFRPCEGSRPYIGEAGSTEAVEEIKVEMVCEATLIRKVIAALNDAHPYETPAYQFWQIES